MSLRHPGPFTWMKWDDVPVGVEAAIFDGAMSKKDKAERSEAEKRHQADTYWNWSMKGKSNFNNWSTTCWCMVDTAALAKLEEWEPDVPEYMGEICY